MKILLPFLAGLLLWSFAEYTLHRFAFHEPRGRNYGSREHLRHHAQRDYTLMNAWQAWAGVLAVGLLLLPWLAGLAGAGTASGWALGAGWIGGYFFYEWVHAAAHLWAPRTAYGAWVRRNHFHHHFSEPLRNHGVTSPVWDHVFGTHTPVDHVAVPSRLAMRWLLDDDGAVREAHRATYSVRGTARVAPDAELERAFANLPPVA